MEAPVEGSLLVKGATGSVGSNICRVAAERGIPVRGLVRDLDAAWPLRQLGVETFCNRFLRMAAIDRRVTEVDISDPASLEGQFGTMVKYLGTAYPDPSHDPSVTTAELGVRPAPLDEGLGLTLQWLRAEGRI